MRVVSRCSRHSKHMNYLEAKQKRKKAKKKKLSNNNSTLINREIKCRNFKTEPLLAASNPSPQVFVYKRQVGESINQFQFTLNDNVGMSLVKLTMT